MLTGLLPTSHEDDPQSWNLYAYTRKNTLRFVDPYGQACRVNSHGGEYDDENPGQSCAEVRDADKNIKPSAVVEAYTPGGLSPNAQFILASAYEKKMQSSRHSGLGSDGGFEPGFPFPTEVAP